MRELKLFVGGYYDDRIFVGEFFEGKTHFSKDIDVYTLSEVLRLPFIENVTNVYEEESGREWEDLSEEEKIEAIMYYNSSDDISGLMYFETEEAALSCKNETLEELEYIENHLEYEGKKQDCYGFFRKVYSFKKEECI